MERDLVPLSPPVLVREGRTILWVERDEGGVARAGRMGELPGRGMTIGCVVAAPAGMPVAGINPESCGGLTIGEEPAAGGV